MSSHPSKGRQTQGITEEDVLTQVQQIDQDENADGDQSSHRSNCLTLNEDDRQARPASLPCSMLEPQTWNTSQSNETGTGVTNNEPSDSSTAEHPSWLDDQTVENADNERLGCQSWREDAGDNGDSSASTASDRTHTNRSPPSGMTGVTVTGTSGSPSGPDLASDVTASPLPEGGGGRSLHPSDMQLRLQQAIEKVEQLDRSLEKKFKEHLDARAVTADLQALVRRELTELSCRGARRETREEADNTLRFLRVLVENDSESDTSSQVTPIFQTQVRFGARGVPPPADAAGPLSVSSRQPPPPPEGVDEPGGTGDDRAPGRQAAAADDYFIRRNIELAQELGGSLAMTEEERRRLEQLLAEEDEPENAFSIDEQNRRLLHSLDDQLSSMGAGGSLLPGTPPPPSGSDADGERPDDGGAAEDEAAGGGSDAELDYLQRTREDREAAARMEALERRLEQLNAPLEVRPLDRCDVDSMIHDTIASLVSVPRADLKSSTSKTSYLAALSSSCDVPGSSVFTSEPADACDSASTSSASSSSSLSERTSSPPPPAEVRSDATLDLRSVLSGRHADNERQLARELRPGSPSAWLVDVDQGRQRLQLVVPRLCRKVLSSLLESAGLQLPVPEEPPPASTAGDAEQLQPSAAA
ncbi:fibrous sheath-interacting protein 1-like [Pollicipes pollicipes]|uniref:fibrous sheath-interacting protein 1-like n=1 Tax=Pollicipes pollicipes TaxID=41117 RepID=UPI0018852308|nr:fibrous sheath-interacting protein 1-like [Pollicipes pollicipes]